MKLFISILLLTTSLVAGAWEVPNESLTYDVMFKWGLINKKAGDVKINSGTVDANSMFKPELTAASAHWADKFYSLRDTLRGTIHAKTLMPTFYEKIAHEGGAYDHDILQYTRSGNAVTAEANRWFRRKKETEINHFSKTHTSTGTSLDMLSAFYYMRSLPYEQMKPGEKITLHIFSGKKKEVLTIKYSGKENVKVNKIEYPGYHITFTFTTENGKTSSDSMEAWIHQHPQRIPLLLEGKLPVGKVRCFYSGAIPSS